MNHNPLTALSPLDGRYSEKVTPLREVFSEFGLIKRRIVVEIAWLRALSECPEIKEVSPISGQANDYLSQIISNFKISSAERVKTIERTTKHDVKSVEYFLKEVFESNAELADICEFLHFGCTSEDINNIAHGLMLRDGVEVLRRGYEELIQDLKQLAVDLSGAPMLSHTHGQAATPTTMGKEIANTAARLCRQMKNLCRLRPVGKMNGAVGNYNAHSVAYPEVNWRELSRQFVHSMGLDWNEYTTQIEPHDYMSEYFDTVARLNQILIDFSRDIWSYISLRYFLQKPIVTETGSSTMPHKVNPIDFENAEGNLGLSNALLNHLSTKLPVSRLQRDLSDSTVLRNVGVALGHSHLAIASIRQGLRKLEINSEQLNKDLESSWEIIGEAIQTVMRRYGVPEPYEKLKAFTRGKSISPENLRSFICTLDIPDQAKKQLIALTPQQYVGYAPELAKNIIDCREN